MKGWKREVLRLIQNREGRQGGIICLEMNKNKLKRSETGREVQVKQGEGEEVRRGGKADREGRNRGRRQVTIALRQC